MARWFARHKPIWGALEREFSESRAFAILRRIHGSDSRCTALAYAKTARLVAGLLRQAGVSDVRLVYHRADGRTMIGDWLPSPAWEASKALLRVTAPRALAGVLARYPKTPTCLSVNSPGTSPGGSRGRLVPEESLRDPRQARGKFVLTRRFPSQVRDKFAYSGILGIISDAKAGGGGVERPEDAVYWDNSWHQTWPVPGGVCFMISPLAGAKLRQALRERREVRLFARADARNYPGQIATVTGTLPGRNPKEELVGIAHLYELGANDNASGAAVLLELARCLAKIRRRFGFRRSVRFIFPFECYGTLAYLRSRPPGRFLAGINLDMVGEDREKCGGRLLVCQPPEASASFADAAIVSLFGENVIEPESGTLHESRFVVADNAVLSDPLVGCPTPLMLHQPDRYYHSDRDTPDKVSPGSLRRAGLAAGIYLGWLAAAGPAKIPNLIRRILAWSLRRLTAETKAHRLQMDLSSGSASRGKIRRLAAEAIGFWLDRTKARLDSIRRLGGRRRGIRSAQQAAVRMARAHAKELGVGIVMPSFKAGPFPMRLRAGIPALDGRPDIKKRIEQACGATYPWSAYLVAALFWANGERSIGDIAHRLRCEFGRGKEGEIRALFDALAAAGYVIYAPRRGKRP